MVAQRRQTYLDVSSETTFFITQALACTAPLPMLISVLALWFSMAASIAAPTASPLSDGPSAGSADDPKECYIIHGVKFCRPE